MLQQFKVLLCIQSTQVFTCEEKTEQHKKFKRFLNVQSISH